MRDVQRDVLSRIDGLRRTYAEGTDMDPVEHCLSRIKSEESMREKCRRLGLPENEQSALREIKDAIGVRVVCAFLNDIYAVRDFLSSQPDLTVVEEKDYIGSAKPNGYRSYHMILRTDSGYYIEVQIRTISMDTWAALEHHQRPPDRRGAEALRRRAGFHRRLHAGDTEPDI
jgi:ppGpp synthetase/RelA/SpoT-type nucleotidyltranferase